MLDLSKNNIVGPKKDWRGTLLYSDSTIQKAINQLIQAGMRIVLVVDKSGRILGTVADGDIRRAILRGCDLKTPLRDILNRNPLVVNEGYPRDAVVQLMLANEIQQIPIVDRKKRVVGLHLWNKVSQPPPKENYFVIMVGGEGKRLHPLTKNRPKPLVEVGGKPILEHIILKAKDEGFSRFVLTTRHLGNMIENYCGDGKKWGVSIAYIKEKKPLGTAGALQLISPKPDTSIVVTNGDVLADFKYADLLEFHSRHQATATMAIRIHEWRNPYGVVETKGLELTGFQEKPLVKTHINAGVYALTPFALRLLAKRKRIDMPELFCRIRERGFSTLAYPLHEPWIDIGKPEDLKKIRASYSKKNK